MYRIPNLHDRIFFRRVSSRVHCSIRGLFVFVILSFSASIRSQPPHYRVCRSSEPSFSHRRHHAPSTILTLLQFSVTSILSPHLSGCRLSVLRCSYSCASFPHRQIFTSTSPPTSPLPPSSYYLSSIISLSSLSLS